MWRALRHLLLFLPVLLAAAPGDASGEAVVVAAEAPPQSPATSPPSSPHPAAPEAKPEPSAPPPRSLERIKPGDAVGILGKQVEGPGGADMGQLVEVLVDDNGRPVAAVIDFGGFLGVGSRKIAVDWRLLEFRPGASKGTVVLHLDRAALQGAPEYKVPADPSQSIDMVGAPPSAGAAAPSNAER